MAEASGLCAAALEKMGLQPPQLPLSSASALPSLRLAVVGHVEWVEFLAVDQLHRFRNGVSGPGDGQRHGRGIGPSRTGAD